MHCAYQQHREGPWCWRQPVMQCACQQQEPQKGCCWKQKTNSGQSLYPARQHDVHVSAQLDIRALTEMPQAITVACLH